MFSSKLFANMRLNFEGHPIPLLPAMLLHAQAGEGAKVAIQAVPQHMPTPAQPQDHLSTPPRQQTFDYHALVLKHGQSSYQNTASFSRSHETATGPFTNVEEEPLGDSFNMSPQGPLKLLLQTKKRKMVVSDFDQEEGEKQDVDLDALRALANAAIALMANLSHYGSDDLAEVHNQDNVTHNVINQVVQAMPLSEKSNIVNQSETEITSDSNIIPYS
nr:hypothetical protein [Tanacetum cinerariifolium]